MADSVDDDFGEFLGLDVTGALAGHRGFGDFDECLVVEVDIKDELVDGVLCEFGRGGVPLDDCCRVDVVVEQVLACRQKFPVQHGRGRRSVADFVLLSLCDLDDHLRRRVFDVHLCEDGRPVVGDDHLTIVGDEHLVHAAGPTWSVQTRTAFPAEMFDDCASYRVFAERPHQGCTGVAAFVTT